VKPTRYHFGDFRLDAAARELWRGDEQIALPIKSLECLAYLLEHRERAVGRDELIAAVWGRADAGDALLTQTIWRARRAVGDGRDGSHLLRTVPRFGYRWTAPVRVEGPPAPASPPAHAAPDAVATPSAAAAKHAPRRMRSPRLALAAGLVALAAALLVAVLAHRPPAPAATVVQERARIVVLPVGLTDASTGNAWLRLGAMDYVASRLREARLSVMPSERVVAIARPVADASGPDAAERERLQHMTGAAYLLVPRVLHVQDQWRFAIDAYAGGRARTYRADAATPLQAADRATAQFLQDLGHAPALAGTPGELETLVQRIDAALLAGDLPEARRLLEETPPAQRTDARLRLRSGRIAFRAGQLEEAESAFTPLATATTDVPVAIRALADLGLGGVAIRRRRYIEAEPHYTTALRLLGETGDANIVGRAYGERAIVNGGLGRLDLAIADMGRARSELERSGDPIGIAYLEINAALVEGQRGRYDAAMSTFDEAIAAFDRFGITDGLATTLADKANLQLTTLDNAGALASSMRAWSLLPRLEDRRLVEYVAQNHIRALRANGRLAEAGTALQHFDGASGAGSGDPVFDLLRAAVFVDEGKARLALQLADEILARIEHAPAGSCSDTIPEAALVLTDAALQSERTDAVKPLLARLGEFVASPEDPAWVFASELVQAQMLDARGDGDAERHFAAALALADASGVPEDIVGAASRYARYLAVHGDRPRAAGLLERIEPYVHRDFRAARAAAALHGMRGEAAPAAVASDRARALAGERVARIP
jgi:DNA-binding winged helix-turn-helix (wHTH) protein